MWKKLIIILILMALVLPMTAGAALIEDRPDWRQCQLKHDLTDLFGIGYEKLAIVSTEALNMLNFGGLPDATIVLTGAKMKAQASVNVIPYIGPSWGWIFDQMESLAGLGNTDLWDGSNSDGMTVGEYKKVLAAKESLEIQAAALPFIGSQAAAVVTTVFDWMMDNAIAGVKTTISRKYATLACMIDKVETVGDWIFILLIVVAGLFVIWSAFEFLTGAGAPEKITGARNRLVWAMVAVGIAFIAKGIIRVVVQLMA